MIAACGSARFGRLVAAENYSGTRHRYTTDASGYELQHEVGRGATASVWAACAKACNEVVAVKLFHLDRLKGDKVLHCCDTATPMDAHPFTCLICGGHRLSLE